MTISVLSVFNGNQPKKDGTFYKVSRDNTFLTKTITPDGKSNAAALSLFEYEDFYTPQNLEELYPLLTKLSKDPHSLLIRAKYPTKVARGDKVYRRKSEVLSYPSPIIAMDIDELPLPKHIGKDEIKAQADYVIYLLNKVLPDVFRDDTGYIAQGSSSSGFSDRIKLHLWIQNYYDLYQEQLKIFFNVLNTKFKEELGVDYNLIDTALYHPAQAHYVADPIFKGVEDPLKERMVYNFGEPSYILDSIAFVEEVVVPDSQRENYLSKVEGSEIPSSYLESKLSELMAWHPANAGVRTFVLSIYHIAVQECYNLDLLDKELLRILRVLRPGQELDYVEQGRKSAINAIFKNSNRDLPEEILGLPVEILKTNDDEFFVDIPTLPVEDTAIFLKASLGTGKTHNISKLLKGFKGTFLSVTNTVALVESNANRFEAGVYNKTEDTLALAGGNIKRMCSTIHSLSRFSNFTFDFIFIDECDAVMYDLLNAPIISEPKRLVIRNALQELLLRAKVVILSDGDISKETMEAYTRLMEGQKKLVKVEHHRENLKDGVAYKHKSIESMLGALQGCLEVGSKCILVSDLSPTKLNAMMTTFERVCPEKVGVVMHANSKMDETFKEIVDNTTEALGKLKVDYLLCSPSITNGVDFNYFDTIFVITTTMNQAPNLRFQALKRERKSKEIHFYMPMLKNYSSGYSSLPESTDWLENYRRLYAVRKERECTNYLNTFNHYLINSGCRIVSVDVSFANPQILEDKKKAIHERAVAIYSGVNVTRHNDAAEMRERVKYFLDDITVESIESFLIAKTFEKAEFLSKVINDFWDVLSKADPEALLQELSTDRGSLFNFLAGISIPKKELKRHTKISMCLDILKRCGIENKDTLKNAVEQYKNYCTYRGIDIIPELKDEEEANDI